MSSFGWTPGPDVTQEQSSFSCQITHILGLWSAQALQVIFRGNIPTDPLCPSCTCTISYLKNGRERFSIVRLHSVNSVPVSQASENKYLDPLFTFRKTDCYFFKIFYSLFFEVKRGLWHRIESTHSKKIDFSKESNIIAWSWGYIWMLGSGNLWNLWSVESLCSTHREKSGGYPQEYRMWLIFRWNDGLLYRRKGMLIIASVWDTFA